MTACFLLMPPIDIENPSKGSLSFLSADSLVTMDSRLGLVDNIIPAVSNGGINNVRLLRKLTIIDEIGMALAGNGKLISDFIYEVRQQLPDWRAENSVAQSLGRMAEAAGVELIAVIQGNDGRTATLCNYPPTETKHLGRCFSIGSGRNEVNSTIAMISNDIETRWNLNSENAYTIGSKTATQVCAHRMLEEMLGAPQARKGWGGYVEWAFWNSSQKRWIRSPRTAHFILRAHVEDESLVFAPEGPIICYDPGGSSARILSLTASKWHDFILEQVGSLPDPEAELSSDIYWTGWLPEEVNFTILVSRNSAVIPLNRTLYADEIADFVLKIAHESVAWGFKPNLRNKLLSEISTRLQLPFIRSEHNLIFVSDGWSAPPEGFVY